MVLVKKCGVNKLRGINMNDVSKQEKKGFNFLAFLFNSAYFAGKGNVKAGIIMALVGFFPVTNLFLVAPYAGFKANKYFSSEDTFSWGRAIGVFIFHVAITISAFNFLKVFKG